MTKWGWLIWLIIGIVIALLFVNWTTSPTSNTVLDVDDSKVESKEESSKQQQETQQVIEETKPVPKFICDRNFYNCADFSSQAEAQSAYVYCGTARDIHHLDADDDGIACEALR